MRVFSTVLLVVALIPACARKPPAAPQPPPATTPAQAPPSTAAPAKPTPKSTPTSQGTGTTTPSAKTPPASKPAASAPKTTAAKPAAPAAAAAKPSAPRQATQAAALDLNALKEELKATKAIGVFTKITLKNQVDDLMGRFRDHYAGKGKATLPELRQSYDLLMMKVLSLLQDHDQRLASEIVASREAIWGLLADPNKFAALDA